jgi:hypothetical protein
MTEQEHLECEIKEYQIELQRHEEAIEQLKVRIEKKKKELLKKMKSFSINTNVKIRLTKFGKELHKKQWEDFWNSHGKLDKFPYEPPKEDENGYCEFIMWDLMNKFGSYCVLGCELPFETVILIEDKDLKDA